MRIGALMMPTDSWDETVLTARRLEGLGFDHLWLYDHLSWRRYRDRDWHATYPLLAGLAASTERIRLGTMVSNPNIRHPVLLAKDAMTIDHISGGRLTLGVGAGGTGFDATVLGQEPLSPAQRLGRLAEFVSCLDGLLRDELRNHDGRWYTFNEARVLPGCVQRPRLPLAIAAGGPKGLRIAAEYGNGWITYGDTSYRDTTAEGTERLVADQLQTLNRYCADIGRPAADIDRIYLIGNTEARPLTDIDSFTQFLERYSTIGFTDLVFHLPRPDDPIWNESTEIVEAIADRFLTAERR